MMTRSGFARIAYENMATSVIRRTRERTWYLDHAATLVMATLIVNRRG